MIILSKKSMQTIEAMLYIAHRASNGPVSAKEICAYQGVSQRYLEATLQKLVNGDLLHGVRGPKGGYVLARDKRKINLAEIYEAIQKGEKEQKLSQLTSKVLIPVIKEIERSFVKQLAEITLEDLCKKALKTGIEAIDKSKSDFVI